MPPGGYGRALPDGAAIRDFVLGSYNDHPQKSFLLKSFVTDTIQQEGVGITMIRFSYLFVIFCFGICPVVHAGNDASHKALCYIRAYPDFFHRI